VQVNRMALARLSLGAGGTVSRVRLVVDQRMVVVVQFPAGASHSVPEPGDRGLLCESGTVRGRGNQTSTTFVATKAGSSRIVSHATGVRGGLNALSTGADVVVAGR
jgi:hypothetical protein